MKVVVCCLSASLLGWLVFTKSDDVSEDQLLVAAAKSVAKMHRVTEKPFKMDAWASALCRAPDPKDAPANNPHGDTYCHVFVDDGGVKPMQTGEGTYPVGSVIVKQKFADKLGKSTELYTLMRKMEPGYDPDHGDWEYALVNRKATQVLARGRLESCIECHQNHRETDYVTRLYIEPDSGENAVEK